MLLSCPKPEALLEFVSVPTEVPTLKRLRLKAHALACPPCQEKIASIRAKWDSYFAPEPDITSSIIKVYSRLQRDETLILKGWKLDKPAAVPAHRSFLNQGWAFRGAVSLGLASMAIFFVSNNLTDTSSEPLSAATHQSARMPVAQFRVEDKNSVKVHYVQPELLQSIEFETTSASGGR